MRVVVSEFVSLDGVAQAPGGPEEDTSGGFRHGGWSMPYFDPEVMGPVIAEIADRSQALLQGRRTYQVSAAARRCSPTMARPGASSSDPRRRRPPVSRSAGTGRSDRPDDRRAPEPDGL
ncbi:MAG TPA: hypothetical protein VND44_04870 [Acidimicrobiales bacterium]|nr:hypothetical protein [Acidimicrobiales bacterium]